MGAGITTAKTKLLARESRDEDTIYQAETQGFICGSFLNDPNPKVKADSFTPPTTTRDSHYTGNAIDHHASASAFIFKDEYYRIVDENSTGNFQSAHWIPIK